MSTKLGTLTLDLVARIGNFTAGMRQASSSAEREMQRAGNSVNTMDGLLKKLAATAGAAFSINQIVNYADSYTGMVNKLKLVTNTQSELSRAMDDTHKIAQATASDWNGVLDVYTKFQGLSKRLGIDQAEVARITETVTKTVSMSGQSAAASEAALLQFGQALNTGLLRGAELTSVLSQAPALAKAIAQGMGVAVGDLKKLGEEGKITSEKMRDALLKMSGSVDAEYAKTATTVAASFNLIKNEAVKMVGEFDATSGASEKFVNGMKALSENMGVVTKAMMIGGAYMAGTYIALLSATAVGYVRNTIEAVRYQIALAGMQANAVGATRSLVLLRAASSAALGVLFSPVGLGVALAGVAAGYLLMKDGADDSTKSLRENNESVDDAIKKYKELDEVKRRAQLVSEKANLRDLAKEYDEINSKLITATYSFSRHNDMTTEQSKQVNALVTEYKKTGNIDEFSKKINALSFISQTSKDRFNTLGGSVKDAGDQFKSQKTFVDQMAPAVKDVGDQAKQTAGEVAQLSEELKKLLGVNAEGANKSNYLKEMVNLKIDPKLAEMLYEARKASGLIGSGKKLSDDVLKSVLERWRADKGLNKTLEERAKIEERNKKAIEAQGNAMKVNAKVAANAAKYNFASIEAKNNLPKGLISATIMQESKGSIYNSKGGVLTSPSGAQGPAQFMPDTAKRFNVDVTSMKSSAEGVAKYYVRLLDLFDGDLNKAISAYHAGEGNVQRGTNIGPVNRQYVKNIKGYMAGSSGVKFNEEYSSDDWIKEQEKLVMEREKYEKEQAEKQKQLALEVATYKERVNTELADKIKEVNEAGFGEAETKRLTDEYQKRAAIDIQVSEAAHADKISEYSDYLKSEEVLLNESFARRQRDLKLDLSLTVDEYKKASLLLEGERDKELQKARWRALEVRQAMVDQIKGLSAGADEIFAQATMSPADYDRWSIENNRSNAKADLKNQRIGVEQDIMTSDLYSTDDDRYEALLEAHREYRDGMAAIDVEYAEQVKELDSQRFNDTMSIYSSLLSQAGSVWGDMTQIVKDSAGESSAAYKAMYLVNQGIAMGQATINAFMAYSQVLAQAPYPLNMTLAPVALGMGMANVGMIAAQTISGMAHDGIDNIPEEGTWLLDEGERVVDSRTNSDLKNYLAEGGGGSGDVHISVQVTDSGVSTQSNQSDQKQLGQMIGNAVRTVIRQEQRQGGLLSR